MSTTQPAAKVRGLVKFPLWSVLAATEARLVARNKTVAITAVGMPVGMTVMWLIKDGQWGAGGGIEMAIMQLLMLLCFTVFLTSTMTLAARRNQLYLKRLRSSPLSTMEIILGLTATPIVMCLAQAALLFVVAGVAGGHVPQRPVLLLPAVLVGSLTCAALAFLTAAYTKTAEAAQITAMPVFALLMGGTIWTMVTPFAEVTWWMLALPGGAVTQLMRVAWGGSAAALPSGVFLWELLVPAVVAMGLQVAVACAVAARLFRWEPRDQ